MWDDDLQRGRADAVVQRRVQAVDLAVGRDADLLVPGANVYFLRTQHVEIPGLAQPAEQGAQGQRRLTVSG